MRTLLASGIALVALVAVGLLLSFQYTVTSTEGSAVNEQLSPAADAAASLTLQQANASGSLSDYLMLSRAASLDEYRQSVGKADVLIGEIAASLPPDDQALADLLAKARAAQKTWIKTDAAPSIALMEAGKRPKAMKETNSKAAWTAYNEMTAASNELHHAINASRDTAANVVNDFVRLLGVSLLVIGILVLAGLAAFYLGLQGWVLSPLDRVREDILQAARVAGHETPIVEVGPPEMRAVAVDAELLRRGLVREIDETRAAREGLIQDAPLVAAMQAELLASIDVVVDGLDVAGTSQSAEGVMAGDWWDPVPRPDGSLAVVVADVSGHGPEASVTAVRVRSILRAGLLAGLEPDAVVAMAALSCADDAHFVTGIVLVLDPVANLVHWCNAGHHPAIVVTRDKEASLCELTGPLISSLGGQWTTQTGHFGPGDVVVAFTDGLVESRNNDGDELESSKVSQFIRGLDAPVRENPEELIARLLAAVRHRAADWRRDDVTLVAAARRR
jgi:sigma-B regulation protein RsbU (phosphoserine phosphatase)